MTQLNVLPIASILLQGCNGPVELPYVDTFPGAARC